MADPIVLISSYPPRLCGIGTFTEEAREFIQKQHPERDVLVISHTDGAGEGVFPLIDLERADWWKPVVEKIEALNPYSIHIEHEYSLYRCTTSQAEADDPSLGFLDMLEALKRWPVVFEPHTVHGRLCEHEALFLHRVCELAEVVLFKCAYQRWRLHWTFSQRGWRIPRNILIVPHGARSDYRWSVEDVPQLRSELGLDAIPHLGSHLVGLVGWIQSNKRWDILTSMWEEVREAIHERSGIYWDLFAAGAMRDPNHAADYHLYRDQLQVLERKRMAHFYEFVPRGEVYYKIMAVCDFIVLPSVDETQSGTLARIIALNKPYITSAPMEGLTSQTLESEGGLLFTTKQMLKEKVVRLACDEKLRLDLGNNLQRYLTEVVAWEVVARLYSHAYDLAREAVLHHHPVEIPMDF